jgi:carbon starvation protein
MNTLPVLLGALCVYALFYRYYSAFIAAKALALDDRRITPGHTYADGHNYVASPRWVLFGHHFAAIAGAGPLVGPTLAAQFGFAPGFLWLLIGAVLAGCVQDFTVLVASIRHRGRSLADIARTEISHFAGFVAMVAVLFILLVTLAGLGIVVVNALSSSPWGVFTIGMTIPIAVIMGLWMFKSHAGTITVTGPSIFGVVCLIGGVIAGHWVAQSGAAAALTFPSGWCWNRATTSPLMLSWARLPSWSSASSWFIPTSDSPTSRSSFMVAARSSKAACSRFFS